METLEVHAIGDDLDAVMKNRAMLTLPAEPQWLEQIHSSEAVLLPSKEKILKADASFTTNKNTVCAVMTADCLPLLITDREGSCVAAIHAGVDRVHGSALGIGERVGNTPMDLRLVNLKLMGYIDSDLSKLHQYCELVSKYCKVPITANYPVVGSDAFRTGTGVHAAAVIKAQKKGHSWLADRVYSGVPAGEFGLRQKIEIGPMSGQSNIIFWLQQQDIDPEPELVEKIYDCAKESTMLLSDSQIHTIIKNYQDSKS